MTRTTSTRPQDSPPLTASAPAPAYGTDRSTETRSASVDRTVAGSHSMGDAAPTRKPLRYKVGIGLLILYPLLYVAAGVIPFLPLPGATRVGAVAIILAAAEGILLLAIACVGKEAYQSLKAKLRRRKHAPRTEEDGR